MSDTKYSLCLWIINLVQIIFVMNMKACLSFHERLSYCIKCEITFRYWFLVEIKQIKEFIGAFDLYW